MFDSAFFEEETKKQNYFKQNIICVISVIE